ncbi:TPA: hypothetical protein DCX16_06895 [bacterium]|nr:hypothetical protein [bacterium]
MDKKDIVKRFSRFASSYKGDVQRIIGEMLIGMLNSKEDFSLILEIGCGNGATTRFIKERFSNAKIVSLDISEKMVMLAKDITDISFIVADGERFWFKERFDIIISNLVFQWFSNLKDSLILYKSILREDGILLFSIFGYNTLWELREASRELLKSDIKTKSSYFLKKEELIEMLGDKFTIKENFIEKSYTSIMDLLYSIRYAGGLDERYIWTKGMIKKLDSIYRNRFKEIRATYHTFLCKGKIGYLPSPIIS